MLALFFGPGFKGILILSCRQQACRGSAQERGARGGAPQVMVSSIQASPRAPHRSPSLLATKALPAGQHGAPAAPHPAANIGQI